MANVGTGTALWLSTLVFYQSTDATITTSDAEVGEVDGIRLSPGRTRVEELFFAPLAAGTYFYGACVAVGSSESDMTNNCSRSVRVVVSD